MASLDNFESLVPTSSQSSESIRISIFELPQEIFVEIFALLCKPLTKSEILPLHGGEIYDWKIQPVTPLFLGSICSAWRSIVWSTPTLWDSLVLSLSTGSLQRRFIQIELLHQWITRSCGLPLSLHLTSDDFNKAVEQWDRDVPLELYQFIDTYADRRKDLEIVFPSGNVNASFNPVLVFQDIFPHNFPMLHSLALRPPRGIGVVQGRVAIALSGVAAPLLQHFSLRSFYLEDITLPWIQLRSFTTHHLPVDECMEILRRCSNLTRCRFSDLHIEPENYSLSGPVVLPNIKHFEVDNSSAHSISKLLETCQCPTLKELVIRLSSNTLESLSNRLFEFEPLLRNLSKFLSRSSSPFLRSVFLLNLESEVEQVGVNPSLLIECLRAAHSIEILHLSFVKTYKEGLSQSFLHRLDARMTIQGDEEVPLPNLREFCYEGCVSATPAILIDVLKCRYCGDGKSVAQLKLASIIVDNVNDSFELMKDDTSRLEELIKTGMNISISVIYSK